jgi:23S rRNA pseudouridine1911/1915/1917 synthase
VNQRANSSFTGDRLSFVVDRTAAGVRLDAFLASQIAGWSRSRLARLIGDEDVLVNGRPAKPSYKVREGDEIDVELAELPATEFVPEHIPLDIVYEDDYLAVINKPAGMVVHPGAGVTSGTLANAIAYHFFSTQRHRDTEKAKQAGSPPYEGGVAAASADGVVLSPGTSNRIGIVHRLDKDTSGLIVVAKDEQTAEELSRQFHAREVEKSYVALVHGVVQSGSGKIDRPIARDRRNRLKMTVSQTGRSALTLWKVRQRFEKFTLLDIDIKTGRTHQIRVHLASINHPVVGDTTYNAGRDNTVADTKIKKAITDLDRFFLHAERLAFTHPKTGETIQFSQRLPHELEKFLTNL